MLNWAVLGDCVKLFCHRKYSSFCSRLKGTCVKK